METNLVGMVSRLELECYAGRNKYKELETKYEEAVSGYNKTIEGLTMSLSLEKLKNSVLSYIVRTQTSIDISELFSQTDDGIIVNNFEGGDISVGVRDYVDSLPKDMYTLHMKRKKGGKKTENKERGERVDNKHDKTEIKDKLENKEEADEKIENTEKYRVAKKMELVEENPKEQEEKIKQVDLAVEELKQENNLDIPVKEFLKNIDSMIGEITKTRVVNSKACQTLKETRVKLLGRLDVGEYTKLVKENNTKVESILGGKGAEKKKIVEAIRKTLSPLDQRLISYDGYYNTELSPEEIHKLVTCVELTMVHSKRYVPFSYEELCGRMYNYMVAVSPVKDVVKMALVNRYGFSNVVYRKVTKEEDGDPYSFYILKKIEQSGRRCWNMECRLYEFSTMVREKLLDFCIKMFRKMYFDMFGSNMYVEGYKKKTVLASLDCEQLLVNIIDLSKRKSFCNVVRVIIMEKCLLKPTKLDTFDLSSDDSMLKKSFSTEEDLDGEIKDSLKRVFDGISDADMDSIMVREE